MKTQPHPAPSSDTVSREATPASASRRPPFLGLVGAVLLLAASMTPSLLPRHWIVQAVVSGVLAAVGYGLGTLLSHLWRLSFDLEPPPAVKRGAWVALGVLGSLAVVAMTVRGLMWQRRLHELVGVPSPSTWGFLLALVLALLLAAALILIARGVRMASRWVGNRLARWLPPRLAGALGAMVVAVLIIGILDGVVVDGFFAAADEAFRVSDELVDGDVERPDSRLRSGGPGSLVAFGNLGAQGRRFVTGGPPPETLADFTDRAVTEPIRAYAGLDAAQGDAERAELVVEELERTGAFDREILCVMVATGTGRIDPQAAAALEYLWAGDTALAALQYSHLPSWMSFLVDAGRGREAGEALFNAVHERWSSIPRDERPLLLVFGESLGADGAEAAFSGIADLRNRTDGALFVGPPNFAELWSRFTRERDPGTSQRLPLYEDGSTVRFVARPSDLGRPDEPWPRPRVVYLQHASDPVVWWSPRLILRRPDWLGEPRAGTVLPAMRWYPLVTFAQITADLPNAITVPAGSGHNYGRLVVDAWAAIAPPPGWTPSDTARLRRRLAATLGDGDRHAARRPAGVVSSSGQPRAPR